MADVKWTIKPVGGEAIVTIVFGLVETHGWRITKSKYGGYYLQPPAVRTAEGDWKKVIFIRDKEIWKRLEEKIIGEFEEKQSKFDPTDVEI